MIQQAQQRYSYSTSKAAKEIDPEYSIPAVPRPAGCAARVRTSYRAVMKKKKELSAILTDSTVRDSIVSHISNRNVSASSHSSFSAGVKESIDLYVPTIGGVN
jgi:hypothetical protein